MAYYCTRPTCGVACSVAGSVGHSKQTSLYSTKARSTLYGHSHRGAWREIASPQKKNYFAGKARPNWLTRLCQQRSSLSR